MIVITSFHCEEFKLYPGDTFNLIVSHQNGDRTLLTETVTKEKTIDFIASFRFADENGNCDKFHLCGFFGKKDDLPYEIENANHLTKEQRETFLKTVNTKN